MWFTWVAIVASFSFITVAGPALGQNVGHVVAVTQATELQRGNSRVTLLQNMQLQMNDVITTGRNGRAQIIFEDDTRIAIGANSRLVIEDILFDSDETASRFLVRAVGGAFRFLSGNSRPEAYTVNTPIATLGVRGTTFDFAVTAARGVDVATFDGEVSLCYLDGGCAFISGRCTILSAPVGGERFEQPESQAEQRDLLQQYFPFAVAQRGLRRDFRADVRSCRTQRMPERSDTRAPTRPSPTAPAQPKERPQPTRSAPAQPQERQPTTFARPGYSGGSDKVDGDTSTEVNQPGINAFTD